MKHLFTLYTFVVASLCAVLLCSSCSKPTPEEEGGTKIQTYTITFDSNGGSDVESQEVNLNDLASEPDAPQKSNYSFDGWYSDAELATLYDFATKVTADLTLYAKWSVDSFAVTFESNGGTAVESQEVEYNTPATKPADPVKDASIFAGWYSDASFTSEWSFKTKITANTTLYAKWDSSQHTVTFDSNGGTEIEPIIAEHESFITMPADPTKAGHTFVGWYSNRALSQEWDAEKTRITADITLYAKWKVCLYEVVFNTNGGSEVRTQRVYYQAIASKPAAPTKEDCIFAGWYSDTELTQEWDFETLITENVTLNAKWLSTDGIIPDLGTGNAW